MVYMSQITIIIVKALKNSIFKIANVKGFTSSKIPMTYRQHIQECRSDGISSILIVKTFYKKIELKILIVNIMNLNTNTFSQIYLYYLLSFIVNQSA